MQQKAIFQNLFGKITESKVWKINHIKWNQNQTVWNIENLMEAPNPRHILLIALV